MIGDGRLSEDDIYEIAYHGVTLHKQLCKKLTFTSESNTFMCTLRTDRKYGVIGDIGGYIVYADIDHDTHKEIQVRFLLSSRATHDPIVMN